VPEPGRPRAPIEPVTEYAADVSGWEPSWKQAYRFGVLLIFPPDPPLSAVNALRGRYAWSQGGEGDAHISLTVPFPRALTVADWEELEAIAAKIEPFHVHYGPLMNFLPVAPGVCLQIEPQGALAVLLERLETGSCFEGARTRPYPFVAHMTIAELISVDLTLSLMEELKDEAPQGTFLCAHVSYAVPDAGFRFTERARLTLGLCGAGRDRP
jgi:2'-5' RNA ligase